MATKKESCTILVTGGEGLIGQAIKKVINEDAENGIEGQTFIFLSSKEADLS